MKYILFIIALLLMVGCSNLAGICPGTEPGQFYLVKNQNFILFSMNYVVELKQIDKGPDKGKLIYLRKAWPSSITEEEKQDEERPKRKPREEEPKEEKREEGGW